MSYFGNVPPERFSAVTKDSFDGDGSTTAFTLTNPGTTNGVEVFVENVQQEPTTAYSVSGTTLTFTAAPVSGTGNIYVVNRGTPVSTITHPPGTALEATSGTFSAGVSGTTGTFSGVVGTSATGALTLPTGTTAQRPGSPTAGLTRFNTTLNKIEVYADGEWEEVTSAHKYTISALVVAGGAGGGGASGGGGGGGGAGGMRSSTTIELSKGTSYDITVGGGGSAGSTGSSSSAGNGTNGTNSSVGTLFIATGGGGGGAGNGTQTGQDGGSGGGGGYNGNTGGSGTVGQGNDGGNGYGNTGGGGGGAGAAGSTSTSTTVGGNGGVGSISTFISDTLATAQSVGEVSGSDVYYAGGGGGAGNNGGGSGGTGGGGNGGANNGAAGTANTGGAGGGGYGASGVAAAGGSGVVILKIPTASYSGTTTGSPNESTSGSDTILIYKSSGTYTA